jgi:hypothetical protein
MDSHSHSGGHNRPTQPPTVPEVTTTPTKRGVPDRHRDKPVVIDRSAYRALLAFQKSTRSQSVPAGIPMKFVASAALAIALAPERHHDDVLACARELFVAALTSANSSAHPATQT